MPASICCTNCRTKYSLLNREAGCSNCALSFCKKCLGYRAIISNLSDKPLTVCYDCYKKLEAKKVKDDVVISSTPLPSSYSNTASSSSAKNWWGDGLPPPSFRNAYSRGPVAQPQKAVPQPTNSSQNEMKELEDRHARLHVENVAEPLTIKQIEARLANLRGCDVELIRNPKSWFAKDNDSEMGSANNVEDLMKMAKDRARLEEMDEELEKRELDELEERRRRLIERENENAAVADNRESVVTNASDFSLATREELNEIDEMLENAQKKVAESKKQEENDADELRRVMSKTRQKSLDAMQWNEKINKEIGGFWERQNEKDAQRMEEDEDDKSITEEEFKKILYEAENALDEAPAPKTKNNESGSPKKRGFFEKIFRRESRDS